MFDSILKQPSKLFWSIAGLYVLLGLVYAWATPPFESSDEYKHFPVVQHIQQTGELVVLDPANEGKWKQEGAQPPLYYWLMAAATSWVDTSDLDQVHIENRHAFIGNAAQIKNKNLIFHDPETERWPWSGSILAVYLIRFFSIGLGIGTLWFGWLTGRLLLDEKGALFVVALTAFNPMFLFVSAAVNNDSLSIMLGSAGLFMLVKVWQSQSAGNKPRWIDYATLGLICGLAMLTKLSLATLLLLAGLVTARGMFLAWQTNQQALGDKSWHSLIQQTGFGLMTLAITLALVGPWLLRNLRLYGDLTGLSAFIEVQGTRDNPTVFGVNWVAEFGTFFRSFWGLFGGVNVFAPQWFYTVCNLLFLVGFLGLVWNLIKKPKSYLKKPLESQQGIVLPILMVLITMVLLIRWTIISPAFQGRLLFPAIIGVNILWVKGLQFLSSRWPETSNRFSIPLLSTLFLFIMAGLIPFTHIAPAYGYPNPTTVPAGAEFGPITYMAENGESISLVGVELEPGQTAAPNDQMGIAVTLYWTTETGVSTDYVTAVHALGREFKSVGQVDRHPGWGMWPPTRWRPGEIYADPYHVWLNPNSASPALLRLDVSIFDSSGPTNIILTPMGTDGSVLDLVLVGEAKLGDTPRVEDVVLYQNEPDPIDFVDFVTLVSMKGTAGFFPPIDAGKTITVPLHWRANGTPTKDYTVFVQLISPVGDLIASGDAPPLNGDYPTRLWEVGESIIDVKTLQVPADAEPGTYKILVGMYDPNTGEKMPRLDGQQWVESEIEIR